MILNVFMIENRENTQIIKNSIYNSIHMAKSTLTFGIYLSKTFLGKHLYVCFLPIA